MTAARDKLSGEKELLRMVAQLDALVLQTWTAYHAAPTAENWFEAAAVITNVLRQKGRILGLEKMVAVMNQGQTVFEWIREVTIEHDRLQAAAEAAAAAAADPNTPPDKERLH